MSLTGWLPSMMVSLAHPSINYFNHPCPPNNSGQALMEHTNYVYLKLSRIRMQAYLKNHSVVSNSLGLFIFYCYYLLSYLPC